MSFYKQVNLMGKSFLGMSVFEDSSCWACPEGEVMLKYIQSYFVFRNPASFYQLQNISVFIS